jgi:hypothetical protein
METDTESDEIRKGLNGVVRKRIAARDCRAADREVEQEQRGNVRARGEASRTEDWITFS